MKKLFVFIATTVGSSLDWWLGAKIGIMTGFVLMIVGTGFGIWYGVRLARRYE
ncbi:MAG: hypothetical protein O2973_08290 [Gemmatimonadetes bacterium]|nr:hypothetical protein [Gemmatimonadota bacterium]